MRNGSMSKFFLCCRPIDISDAESVDCFISVAKMDPHPPSDRKPSFRRSFSGALKSVVSESSLTKKRRESKRQKLLRQNSVGSSSSSDESVSSSTNSIKDDPSPCSSSSSSISENSTVFSAEELKTERVKLTTTTRRTTNSSSSMISLNLALWMLLVSLWMTVLWGKLVAVLITTVWVYVVRVYLEEGGTRMADLPPEHMAQLARANFLANYKMPGFPLVPGSIPASASHIPRFTSHTMAQGRVRCGPVGVAGNQPFTRMADLKNRACRLWERREKVLERIWVRFCWFCISAACKRKVIE